MIEALLGATRQTLRDSLGLKSEIDIMPGGHPPATMGEFFISIDERSVVSGDKAALKENYTLAVWVTLRAGVYPQDRRGFAYLNQSKKLTALERSVIRAIHGNQALRKLACNLVGISNEAMEAVDLEGEPDFEARANEPGGDGSMGDVFQMPLYYTGRGGTELRSDWILESEAEGTPCMIRQLQFTGGLRVQNFNIMQ